MIKWRPWGNARLFTFNHIKIAAAAKKNTAAYALKKTELSKAEATEVARLDALWSADLEDAGTSPAAAPTVKFEPADEDLEDITTRNARLDAEEAARQADDVTDDEAWLTDTAFIDRQLAHVRSVYAALGREDVPQDLMPAVRQSTSLLTRVGIFLSSLSRSTAASFVVTTRSRLALVLGRCLSASPWTSFSSPSIFLNSSKALSTRP